MANCKGQIANGKLEDKVFLIGQVAHDKVLEYFKAGDIFVLNTGYEGFSHFYWEAMAMEIPIITTNVGGNPELINDKVNGILLEYNDKENFIAQICSLPKDEKIRNALVDKAKNKIKNFNRENMIRQLFSVLQSIL